MRRASAILLAGMLAVAACGDDGSIFGSTTTAGEATTSAGASTTAAGPSTTAGPTTTAATTTTNTTAATTSTAPLVPVVTAQLDESTRDAPPGCTGIGVSVSLPIVSGLAPAVNTRLNDRIFEMVFNRQDRFLTDASYGCDPAMAGTPPSFLELGFEATTVRAGLLSLRFVGSDYYQGAAHPNAFVFTLNFNPVTGDLLSLEGILVPGGAAALAALAEQHLIDDLYGGDAGMFHSWVPSVTLDMLVEWVVSAAGLEFSFGAYTVGPGVMGAPTIVVPFGELAGIIDPAGPAASA
ncbi:MAG: RsiV family protein [Actinomycetota bacterium]